MARRSYKPLVALTALAIAALAAASLTLVNVTYWVVNATLPPAMKYAGSDVNIAGGKYVKVSYYYDSRTGYNITRISVVGFTGDPTNYTDVIRVCNKRDDVSASVYLRWVGQVGSTGYETYVRRFVVGNTSGTNVNTGVGFIGNTTHPYAGPYTVGPGGCLTLGVHVLIDPELPSAVADGKHVIATYQVNVEVQYSQ
ncbi:MAG: hypothetical protein LM577_00855 [Thermoproteaceae archaeon]|nr:hypothetical protein [Thermoproteaceae archaeon]